jgi:thiaminase/transcriptional activator TenA|uniref:Thiaminase-2/PQQC domain-containing protein n=1 Tax=Attheya septentrionalis TaxID=420275 RepID=A0A7S2XI20_9STRA|mmetsp:Transcript_10021/g.18198  ORF Transcript_10021/g.18198 Transcript_10021/m.18198 type:complete len:222 (+) Transcript_10021:145-810(+)
MSSTPTRFTEELKAAAGEQWDRVIHHKFTKQLASGTIDREVIKRYLIQDHRFLDAFIILLASIIAHARSLEDRIPGCQFLALITGKENTYFERCFEKLSISVEDRMAIPDAECTTGFCNLMKEVAQGGSLAEMLSVIVVCEWSYLSWGKLVEKETVRDDFVTYEWVDLHTGESFEAVVAYLRDLLDREGEIIDASTKEACKSRFLQTMQLEEDFFDFAYKM